ncbi:MAG: hypothetical protein H6602_01080 [Flavobacteriales bacterium]|nr:hypothetical protein [Flavobacteriales bacterium]
MSRLTIPFLFFSFFLFTSAQAQHTVILKDGSQKKGEVKSIRAQPLP